MSLVTFICLLPAIVLVVLVGALTWSTTPVGVLEGEETWLV